MKIYLVFGIFCCCLEFSISEKWIHNTVLDGDGRYHLYWSPPELKKDDSEILFKVEVEAHGYVGFGLSPNGGMAGADLITGWVKGGKVYFQDRYATGNSLPLIDSEQNWHLLEGFENDTHTVFKFKRKLDTCDDEDMVIDDSTMRIIYAYADEDSQSNEPTYHFGKRGTKSAMLLQPKVEKPNYLDDQTILHWDILSPNFTIPAIDTMYWCKIYKTPELSTKHHIIYVKPLLQEGNEEFVHHMLLYECVGAKPEEYDPYVDFAGHQCHHMNMPDAMKRCEGVSIAWAVGGEDIVFPEHVGLPLDPVPGKYFMLEIHYDNQQMKEGIVDESGLRIYYTPKLRQYDAGCLMVGSTISPRAFIPPGLQNYTLTGHSNPDCLQPDMPKDGIKALGVLLHAHLIGRQIVARHFRKNMELHPLAVEKTYDFNYQEYRYYKNEVEILSGDQITVECTYDSSGRTETTFGGESTQEEMCLAFILYYPRLDRYASLSVPTFENINEALNTNLTYQELQVGKLYGKLLSYDWNNVDVREVEELMRYTEHNTHCYLGDGTKNSIKSLISYPDNIVPYFENSSCVLFKMEEGYKETVISSTTNLKLKYLYTILCIFFILFI